MRSAGWRIGAQEKSAPRAARYRGGTDLPIVVEQVATANLSRPGAGGSRLLESTPKFALTPMPEPTESAPPAAGEPSARIDSGSAASGATTNARAARATRSLARGNPSPWVWAGVAVLALVAAFALWFDSRRVQQALRTDVAQRLAGVEAALQASQKAQTQIATDLREAQAKVTLLETRITESQAQQAALEALYRDLAPSRDEIALSELEQMLLVANQQLQLAGSVSSALTALQLADVKLQRLDRPQFIPLRRALSRDIDRLKAVPYVDVAGMSLKLDQALAAIDTLPLAMDERLPAAPPEKDLTSPDESRWRRMLREMWNDVRQLIRIEVTDRPAAPLVPVAQQYYLRENLKLRLLTARIALLARDDASFQADLSASEVWLKQYFDSRAKPVQAVLASLKQLAATAMPGETLDLTRSLEALRVLRLAQDRAPARGGAATPAR